MKRPHELPFLDFDRNLPRAKLTCLAPPAEDVSRVLVLYVGGTIGMLQSERGYVPYPGFLYDNLRAQSRFHDPHSTSLFAHSSSLGAYKQWASRPASPVFTPSATLSSPSTDGAASKSAPPTGPQMTIRTSAGSVTLPCLVTPPSHSGRRIAYTIYEYDPLIDSSDVSLADWQRMAGDLERNYQHFDAFLVLHGTDTMAYTASALSFLLENLGKTVIVTGAQIPLSELRNDAVENLLGAITLAGSYTIPEVALYFNHHLLRGNRSNKASSFDFDAFASPNLPPLARVGINIDVRWDMILRPTVLKPFCVHRSLCADVARLSIYPTITGAQLRAMLAAPLRGLVLECYGSGNAPQRPDILSALREASDRGVIIVNITQCAVGTVADKYEGGRALADAGVIGGHDMTVECALAKLSYLLGYDGLSTKDVRQLMTQPLRGELTLPAPTIQYAAPRSDRILGLLDHFLPHSSTAASTPPPNALPTPPPSAALLAGDVQRSDADALPAERALLPILLSTAAAQVDPTQLRTLIATLRRTDSGTTPGAADELPLLLNAPSALCQPALHAAALSDRPDNVAALLRVGASVHVRDAAGGHTALFYAAARGHLDVVRLLRCAGAHLAEAELDEAAALASGSAAHRAAWYEAGVEVGGVEAKEGRGD